MKIALIYGPFSIGARPIDFSQVMTSPRGLTGSEISCLSLAKAMRGRGHEVTLFVHLASECLYEGVQVLPLTKLQRDTALGFDVLYSWNEPDVFRGLIVENGPLRMVNQQLNDFGYCQPGFDDFVDVYTSPSVHHMSYVRGFTRSPSKWTVLPNGCDPNAYTDMRVRGRVIWASSADRGLHHLLQMWPAIKRQVPDATLRCFYNFDYGNIESVESRDLAHHRDIREVAQRVRYIRHALERLRNLGVEHFGSVSRARMGQEMSEAMVLAYPTDTIRYTEGFSVTTMEACAAGVLPVISDADALGSIYGKCVPMVRSSPIDCDRFVAFVVKGLTDDLWRESVIEKTKELGRQHAWPLLAKRLEKIIVEGRILTGTTPAPRVDSGLAAPFSVSLSHDLIEAPKAESERAVWMPPPPGRERAARGRGRRSK